MTFADGTAEARVAARYAGISAQDIHAAQVTHNAALAARVSAPSKTQHQAASAIHIHRATDRAINWLVTLSGERFPAVTEASIREWAQGVSASEVSAKIDWLKTQPRINSGVGTREYDVPAGRYAIRYTVQGETKVTFLKVTRPAEGPFAGRVFVNIQAGDELYRTTPVARDLFLSQIEEAGLSESSKLYGREIGSCGVCGRTLTDEISRAHGIGPKCSSKMGW